MRVCISDNAHGAMSNTIILFDKYSQSKRPKKKKQNADVVHM